MKMDKKETTAWRYSCKKCGRAFTEIHDRGTLLCDCDNDEDQMIRKIFKEKRMIKSKLKPCPFCGKKAEIIPGQLIGNFLIGCSEKRAFEGCGIRPFMLIETTKAQAIRAWNRRIK